MGVHDKIGADDGGGGSEKVDGNTVGVSTQII